MVPDEADSPVVPGTGEELVQHRSFTAARFPNDQIQKAVAFNQMLQNTQPLYIQRASIEKGIIYLG